jgi:uncharacterized protein YcfL
MRKLLPALLVLLLLAACGSQQPVATSPTFRVSMTIVDATTGSPVRAAIFADDQLLAQDVSERTLELPVDGQRHAVVVRAEGYQEWRVSFGASAGRSLSGPVRLKRLADSFQRLVT